MQKSHPVGCGFADRDLENYVKNLYACSFLFVLLFAIKTALDHVKIDEIDHSASFYDFVIDNAFIFLLPALIIFIIAIILREKGKKM